MHEQEKLDEARYFLDQMKAEVANGNVFRHNLSAFLSAARTVAQYALKEARAKPNGQEWYDKFVKGHPLVRFFASERDANIHDQPIRPTGHADVYVRDIGRVVESVTIVDLDGNLVEVESAPDSVSDNPPAGDLPTRIVYRFKGWSGTEDVFALSESYLHALATLLADGRRLKLLT